MKTNSNTVLVEARIMSSTKNDKNEARIRKSGLDGTRIPDMLVRQPDGRFHIPEPTTRAMDRSSTQDPEHDSRFTHLTVNTL